MVRVSAIVGPAGDLCKHIPAVTCTLARLARERVQTPRVDDGYGDSVSPAEAVERFHRWTHYVASRLVDGRSKTHPAYDDMVQEAKIEVWRTIQDKPHVPATYVAKAARSRMREVLTGARPLTGGDSKPGPKYRPTTECVDWQDEGAAEPVLHLLAAPDLLDAVELAYHRGELLHALGQLQPRDREYVVLRFWSGMTDTEIAARQGVSNKLLHDRWRRAILPRLQKSLAHLATAAY